VEDVQAESKIATSETTTPVSVACLITRLQAYPWTLTVQAAPLKSVSHENEPWLQM